MNIILIKQIALLSALAGAVLGFITLIPFFGFFSFFAAFVLLSAIIICYMKRNDLIGILSIQEGSIYGAIIGIVSFTAYLIVLAPVAALIGLIFKGYALGFFGYLFNNVGSFFFSTIPLALFAILMSGLFNGFTGMVTAWVYQLITGIKKENDQNSSVDFEIK